MMLVEEMTDEEYIDFYRKHCTFEQLAQMHIDLAKAFEKLVNKSNCINS